MPATDDPTLSVQRRDPDRFYASLFLPRRQQPGALAIIALDLELVDIDLKTSQPLLADMRYQWWRDRLQGLAEGHPPQQQPLLRALAGASFTAEVWPALQAMTLDGEQRDSAYMVALARHLNVANDFDEADCHRLARALELARCGQPFQLPPRSVPRALRPYRSLAQLYARQPLLSGHATKSLPPYWLAALAWGQLRSGHQNRGL